MLKAVKWKVKIRCRLSGITLKLSTWFIKLENLNFLIRHAMLSIQCCYVVTFLKYSGAKIIAKIQDPFPCLNMSCMYALMYVWLTRFHFCYECTDEFMVMVIDNPSAKRYSLVGNYTLKVDNRNVMLYSANGLIQTNFSVPIEQIWRLKLAPSSDKDSIYSNFVVLDIIGYVVWFVFWLSRPTILVWLWIWLGCL